MQVTVELVEALGAELVVHTSIEAQAADIDDPDLAEAVPLEDESGASCIARLSPKAKVRDGDIVELAVDTSDLQLFDVDSSRTLRTAR